MGRKKSPVRVPTPTKSSSEDSDSEPFNQKDRYPTLEEFLNREPKIYPEIDENDLKARIRQNNEMLYDLREEYSTIMHHYLALKGRIRGAVKQIDGGTKEIMRQAGIPGGENANFNQQIKWLMQRAQERRDEMRHSKQSGFMKGMLETIKKEAALMKDAKIKILKYPKIDEEVELLMKWNQELIPTIRTDLPEVLKECRETVDKEYQERFELIESQHQEHLARLEKMKEKAVEKAKYELKEIEPELQGCCSLM